MSIIANIFVEKSDAVWIDLLEKLEYIPYEYTDPYIKFLKKYKIIFHEEIIDISTIVTIDKNPIALFPISKIINKDLNQVKIEIFRPLFIKLLDRSDQKKIYKYCLNLMKNIMDKEKIKIWECNQSIPNEDTYNNWIIFCLNEGAFIKSVYPDMYIDLNLSIDELKSKLRKSYKSLINPFGKDCKLKSLDGDMKIWEFFKEMHKSSAGGLTRSIESWDSHKNDILNKNGILVYAHNDNDIFLGGSFYGLSRDEAVYSVAAFNRNRRDIPLGHLIMFQAIKQLKLMQVRWCRLGVRKFLCDIKDPFSKEISIGDFKSGFCTNYFPRIELIYENKDVNEKI